MQTRDLDEVFNRVCGTVMGYASDTAIWAAGAALKCEYPVCVFHRIVCM